MIMNNLMLLPKSIHGFCFCMGVFHEMKWFAWCTFFNKVSICFPFLHSFISHKWPFYIVLIFHSLAGAKTMNTRMTLPTDKGLISKELFTPTNLVTMRIWKTMIYLRTCWDWLNGMKDKYYLIKRSQKLLIWGPKKKEERWKSGPHCRLPLRESW